jgi:ATP-dependent protease ClpP protease subunit
MARGRPGAGPRSVLIQLCGEIAVGSKTASVAGVRAKLRDAPHVDRIRLIVNSPGGNIAEAFRIYATLRETGATISAVGIGRVASAAVIPFLAADHRELKRGAVLHIHNAHADGERRMTARRFRAWAESAALAADRMLVVMVVRTGQPRRMFARAMRADKPLRAVEALGLGLAHEVEDGPPVVAATRAGRQWCSARCLPALSSGCRPTCSPATTWPPAARRRRTGGNDNERRTRRCHC